MLSALWTLITLSSLTAIPLLLTFLTLGITTRSGRTLHIPSTITVLSASLVHQRNMWVAKNSRSDWGKFTGGRGNGWMSVACVYGMESGGLCMPGRNMMATRLIRLMRWDTKYSKISWLFTTEWVSRVPCWKWWFIWFPQDRLSWAIWLYKDIGLQGMVYVPEDTAYRSLFKDFLARKHRLGKYPSAIS